MLNVIFGRKIGMTEAYLEGKRFGVTKIKLFPLTVTQIKTQAKDGYEAVQVGFAARTHKRRPFSFYRELDHHSELTLNQVINPVDVIHPGSVCKVQGTSKGKGFAGVVKRWNFSGGPRTHGQSDRHRAPGSIGQGTTPGRVHKGKKMAGRMGSDTVTVKNAKVMSFDAATNTITITGPVPGSVNSLIRLEVTTSK